VALTGALAAAQLFAWLAQWQAWPPVGVAVAAASSAVVAAAVFGIWAYRAQRPAELAFNGHEWQWNEQWGELGIAIDLQGWMLLRFRPAGPAHRRRGWLVASRGSAGTQWPALRTALYSNRRDAGDPATPVVPPG
jgi:hypothetical protein